MEPSTERAVSKPLVYRKERKYALTDTDLGWVETVVRSHPSMFFRPFPARYINNIYFDTPSYGNYNDNQVGSPLRHKFRIRWYGEQFGLIEKPVLEIKIKKGCSGAKRHFSLTPILLEKGISKTDLKTVFAKSDLPLEIQESLKFLEPTLLNRYFRKYYLSANRKFRVTLDTQLRYTRISSHQNYFLRIAKNDSDVVMEMKYDVEDDQAAGRVSSGFPFRLTKNSKYVNGVDHLDLW